MFHILFSFAPWIIYWVLCGAGNAYGIIIALVLSLFLVIPQMHAKDINLMDLASLAYFSAAIIGTFFFDIIAFVDSSGFLGYSVLFFMAMISLVIKRPYTLQASKRDYPEAYWNDRTFLAVNNIITIVWAVIFLSNAVICLGAHAAISNVLIVIGVVFSILFPLKAPIYFAAKSGYDWTIERQKKEWDVIVVGSGIGGLTCGALLSKRGYRVLVLEQHSMVGGYCSSFSRKGFTFNTGVEDVSGLWDRGPVAHLLRELGIEREDMFVKSTTRYIFKGKDIEAGSLEDFMDALSNMFPDEKESITAFFSDAEKAYEESYADGIPLPAELIAKVYGEKKLLSYPIEHPHFYEWMNESYEEKLEEYFENDDLKRVLCALLGYLGTEPDKTPASSALAGCVSYFLHGGYFPRGGAQRFADSLKKFIASHGGEVRVKCGVERILTENGNVRGVEAEGREMSAPIVVSNANARTTFLDLLGSGDLDRRFTQRIEGLKMSISSFMVFLGVDMDLSSYPVLIKNLDDGYEVVINSNADPSLAPRGKASVTILTIADYHDFPERGTEAYQRMKDKLTRELIHKAEKIIPDMSRHIVVMDAATPKTFERYTSMPDGAIYSFDQSIGVKRPYFKTPIKGLYLAGASTFPGGGIEGVVISGVICASDIMDWK